MESTVPNIRRSDVNTIKHNLGFGQWSYVAHKTCQDTGAPQFLRIIDIKLNRAGTPVAKFLGDGLWYAIDAVHLA